MISKYECPKCGQHLQKGDTTCPACRRRLTIHDQIAVVFVDETFLGNTYHLDFFWEVLSPYYPDFKKENLGLYDHAYGNKGGCAVCAIEPNGGMPLFQADPPSSGFYKVLGGLIPFNLS